jgi:hypothetical protein
MKNDVPVANSQRATSRSLLVRSSSGQDVGKCGVISMAASQARRAPYFYSMHLRPKDDVVEWFLVVCGHEDATQSIRSGTS